jgi:hypothetical protein
MVILRSGEGRIVEFDAEGRMRDSMSHKEGRAIPVQTVSLVRQQHLVASEASTALDESDGCENQSHTLVRMKAKFGELEGRRSSAGFRIVRIASDCGRSERWLPDI